MNIVKWLFYEKEPLVLKIFVTMVELVTKLDMVKIVKCIVIVHLIMLVNDVKTIHTVMCFFLFTTAIFVIMLCKGLACSYNPCENGGTCYREGYGKDQELSCVCPANFHGERCEKIKQRKNQQIQT